MYSACRNKDWVEVIQEGSGKSLHYGTKFSQLVQRLPKPRDQYPCLLVFCGSTQKQKIVENLYPRVFPRRRQRCSAIDIYLDLSTRSEREPVLLAELTTPFHEPSLPDRSRPHFQLCRTYPVAWAKSEHIASITDAVAARLILPWADVVCVSVDDYGGYTATLAQLRSWAGLAALSQTPAVGATHIVIVGQVPKSTEECDHDKDDILRAAFASLRYVDVGSEHAFDRLSDELQDCIAMARHKRQEQRLLFSAAHREALLTSAVAHLSRSLTDPFDLIAATRGSSDWTAMSDVHVQQAFELAQDWCIPRKQIQEVLSSALLLDAMPPSSHIFKADEIFSRIYSEGILYTLSRVLDNHTEATITCDAIRKRFCDMYDAMCFTSTEAHIRHTQNITMNAPSWPLLRSSKTCLCCIRDAPEHTLSCDHAICENCVHRYGVDNSLQHGNIGEVTLDICPLCSKSTGDVFRLKPPTAGVRVLSIDGGGIKGIIPLELLGLMQEKLGPNCRIQNLFDLCIGTSAGGLIALKIFGQGCTVAQAIPAFVHLSKEIFAANGTKRQSLMATISRVFKTLSRDELYESSIFDEALVDQFGNTRLFDTNAPSGTRVGVVATAIDRDTSTPARVFSNYNGCGGRSHSSGYRIQRANDYRKEVTLWQAARATSAAPGYFRPALTSVGAFQDGCMFHNNPVNLALWESRILWPQMSKPDVVLSLGTGNCRVLPSPIPTSPKLSVRDTFPFRVARSFWTSMDGSSIWRDLINRLDEESRKDFFRLSLEYPGAEPAMDDFNAIEGLAHAVRQQPQGPTNREDVLMALLIASLFFELTSLPILHHGRLLCEGWIRCRDAASFRALLRLYPHGLELFNGDSSMACWMDSSDICALCHRYGKFVRFFATSVEDQVRLSIKWEGLTRMRYLGGMPQRLDWFIKVQGLDDVFGYTSRLQRVPCVRCESVTPLPLQKRHLQEESPRSTKRRRY